MRGPRSIVTAAVASVNHASKNRVGSTLSCHSVRHSPPGRHQARARVRSAVTGASCTMKPPEGPAPIPSPQRDPDQKSSAMPWTAAVRPLSVRVVPAATASAPIRQASNSVGVATQMSPRPWYDHTPSGSDANDPEKSSARPGEAYWSPGENDAVLKLDPPGN